MDNLKDFLESSTIHGLVYIATTGKFVRCMWIITVLTGFIASAYLIDLSFENWAEQPITTSIETLPITEITLPTVDDL